MTADLYLLGSGILSFLDVTLYTQRLLKQCGRVLYLHDMPTLDGYLDELCPGAVNLMPLYYVDGRERTAIYEDIVRHVLGAVAEGPRPVGLLLHGHPYVYSSISQRVVAEARAAGHVVEIVPAVSSIDRMVADLEVDIGNRGVQILHATVAIDEAIPINPDLDCFVFQIGALRKPLATRAASLTRDEVEPLKRWLGTYYPPDHAVTIVECAVELGYRSRLTPTTIGRLEDAADAMDYTATLFVPAVQR